MIRSAEKNGERTDTMEKSDIRYQAYVSILEEELKPAMGCTEPIAIAYCAAVAREVLGGLPEKVKVGASGSMIKNVKSVIVPNTDHLKGIPAAAAAGIVAGDPKKELEVIASVTKEQITAMKEFLQTTPVEVEHIDNGITFDIIVTLTRGTDTSMVRIANYHTNVVHIEKNGEVIRDIPVNGEEEEGLTDRSLLDMEHIWDFIHTVDVNDIREVLERQKTYNMAIAREGMRGQYGSNIGALLLDMNGICASSGSACSASSKGASHVLRAIGLPDEIGRGALRLTLSEETTKEEIDTVVAVLKRCVSMLRGQSAVYREMVRRRRRK